MDYEKIFLDWKTRRTFENEMPESSADSKNDTTKCAGMSDTPDRNGRKLSTLCELTIEAGELEKALLDKVYGQEHAVSTFVTGYFQAKLLSMTDPSRRKPAASFLFVGAPGVGKTFLAETVAEALQCPFARFDMSEYADKDAVIEFSGADGVYKGSKEGNVT